MWMRRPLPTRMLWSVSRPVRITSGLAVTGDGMVAAGSGTADVGATVRGAELSGYTEAGIVDRAADTIITAAIGADRSNLMPA